MRIPTSVRAGWMAVLMGLFAAGCAVVTVDVDVYKGPLANSEEIQGEQVITMAMGAKPLLVQLRDHMEAEAAMSAAGFGPWPGTRSKQERLDAALLHLRQSSNYAAGQIPDSGPKGYRFRNELAIRVNEILGLYEDTSEPLLSATLTEADRLIEEYSAEREILEPKSNLADLAWWKGVGPHLLKKDPNDKGYATLTNLTEGYRDYFSVERNGNGKKWRSKTFPMQAEKRPEVFGALGEDQYNERFRRFRESVIEKDAHTLFGEPAVGSPAAGAKNEFIEKVGRITDSYGASRLALRRLLRLGLASIDELHVEKGAGNFSKSALIQALSESAANLVDSELLLAPGKAGSDPRAGKLGWSEAVAAQVGTPASEKDSKRVLVGKLATDPTFAAQMLASDVALAALGGESEYGLSRGSTQDVSFPATKELESIRGALAKAQGALSRGRPQRGIESYIERYLAQMPSAGSPADRLDSAEARELLSALAQFGQKVAQLGNSVILMQSGSGDDERRYVGVLQSVGNSILVHIDELKRAGAHAERLKKFAGPVKSAVTRNATTSGPDVATLDSSRFDAKDVLTQLENTLRAQYEDVIRRHGVDAAGGAQLAKAIEHVAEWRSGMIHLRPASAYLRSSYPAAISGQSTGQRRVNMLEHQALGQIPIAGRWLDGVDNDELKTYLAMDRQSWQSINRVKVAGGGRVNYVIAKDDIGNWYVKQYSTDRTKVFNAMRNVALFSAGSSFGAPMPIRKADGTLLMRTNPVVELQFNKAYAAYSNAMATAVSSLKSRAKGLKEVLETEFKAAHSDAAALKEFQEEVGAVHKEFVVAVDKEEKSDAEALSKLGKDWVQFGEKARKAVNETTNASLAKVKVSASRLVGTVVLKPLDENLTAVRAAIDALQGSIEVIRTGVE